MATLKELYKAQQKELAKGLFFDLQKLNAINKKIFELRQARQEEINARRRAEYEAKLTAYINSKI